MIKQFLGKTILGKFSRLEKEIKKHKPNLKEISKDSHEYKYFLFEYMQICYYVTHKQMHANTAKHNQFRLYNIDLNDIKIQNARCFNVKVS